MVSSREETLVYNIRVTSLVPGRITGKDEVYEPSNMDLAMKLHYLRGVYYFNNQSSNDDLTLEKMKMAMSKMLNYYYVTCGRFKRSESGRPAIICNDCGIRLIEAECDKTIDEWMEMINKDATLELEKLLVYSHPIGPELLFSPIVHVQITKFSSGGFTIGLSWAHALGDAISASGFINMWAQVLAGDISSPHPHVKLVKNNNITKTIVADESNAVNRVGSVGNHWFVPNYKKMVTLSLNVTSTQLSYIQSKLRGINDVVIVPPFEALCAVIWQCVGRVKDGVEPKVVNVFRNDRGSESKGILGNYQGIYSVKADFSIIEANLLNLASLLMDQDVDQRAKIEDEIERDNGLSDFIMYGANLTFVDLTINNFYDLKVIEKNPTYVSYIIDGVGEEGLVIVHPQLKNANKDSTKGWIVTITLPKNQVCQVKSEIEREFYMIE